MDPFETLGVEPRFDLDPAELEKRHRELSRALHPDKHAGEPPAQRRLALSRAIEVNEAYRALRDPIRRAEHVLVHHRLEVGEKNEPPASTEVLMEMMEGREALADAVRAKDTSAVTKLANAMREKQVRLVADLSAALANTAQEDLLRARAMLGELRYARRFLEEVAAFEEALSS